jgi:uncharacterized protein (TIGR03382 family)
MWVWTLVGCPYRSEYYDEAAAWEVCIAGEDFEEMLDPFAGTEIFETYTFDSSDAAAVFIVFHPAIDSECDELVEPTCRLAFDGRDVFVESTGEIRFHKDRTDCTEPPEAAVASCTTPPLDDGRWTFHYADLTWQFDVPGTLNTPCQLNETSSCASVPLPPWGPLALASALFLRRRRRPEHADRRSAADR